MKKKLIWIEALVALAIIAAVVSYIEKPKETERNNACDVDIRTTILPDPEAKLKTDTEVVQALFDHYFAGYNNMPDCKVSALQSAKLISVSNIKHDVPGHFFADITFELQPLFPAESTWATPETSTTTDGWIKNKKGTLSIRKSEGNYYLVI
jgi:hypothetical protein